MKFRKPKLKLIFILLSAALLVIVPAALGLAQTPSSTNYRLEDSQFDFGGGNSSSTNYRSVDAVTSEDEQAATSTNYRTNSGGVWPAYPGVPGQPTLTNTGNTLYNSLDFTIATGGDPSDTNYAIAMSSDNFTTTYFMQSNDTLATTTVWQTYTAWGGASGQRVTGLNANTTYKIKVKARIGSGTESGYSAIASAATAAPNFTMTISGVALNTNIAAATTTVASTPTSIGFGSLVPGTVSVAAQQITVTTNAASGYTTTIQENADLSNGEGQTISPVSGTNAAPASFPSSVSTGAFGYHTTDASLCTGTATRFSANDTYAAMTASPLEIACNQLPVGNETTTVIYKVLVGALQSAGSYTNTITYISTGKY